MKKVEIINFDTVKLCEEYKTEINNRKVTEIDTSSLKQDRRIFLKDKNKRTICEIYVPETALVVIEYLD
jgi:hypothetical protein